MNNVSFRFAQWKEVVVTFKNHINHYAEHGGGENALVGLRAEGSVTLQYAGRVLYELFQNALDQAHTRAVVTFSDGILLVGNDGNGIQVNSGYDYSKPVDGVGRSDFHALCALHTSNKSADRQFGNKGIGFRSVFGVADDVRIWSRCQDGGWWGMELRQRLVPTQWLGIEAPTECFGDELGSMDDLVRGAGEQPRPSFHFPRLLRSFEDPADGCADISTAVLLQVVDSQHQQQIEHEVEQLRNTRFQFVGLRRPKLHFHINGDMIASRSGWPLVSQARHHDGFADLKDLAQQAQHPVEKPKVAIAWAEDEEGDHERQRGLFYNHLPTRMSTGLPIDVHGDFQVKADREGMDLHSNNGVGKYNLALLQKAAEAHVEALHAEAARASVRSDFWNLADRPENASTEWKNALGKVLFPSKSLDMWVCLARKYFVQSASESTCRAFWSASLRWIEWLTGCGRHTDTWAGSACKLCDQLVRADVHVIPVVVDEGVQTVALPSRQAQGHRAKRRVFYWPPKDGASIPSIPRVLLAMGRVVTSFELDYFKRPAGIQLFAEAELLPELRQVPNDPKALDVENLLCSSDQANLLLFAYRLTATRRNPERHFAWRAFVDSQDEERIGRALATMFLPTIDELWEPGRQLSRDRVDIVRLAELIGHSEGLEEFVALLGVAPANAVAIVEGGRGGLVPALSGPPRLQEAGSGSPIPALEAILAVGVEPSAVFRAVEGLPPDNKRSQVHELVRGHDWIDAGRFKKFEGIPSLRSFIAPLDVVLNMHDPQRVFFGVPENEEDIKVLKSLGALNHSDDESCVNRVAETLRSLRDRIPNPSKCPASVGHSLAALFNRLMARLGDKDHDIPILVEQAGRLEWLQPYTEAWIARRDERQELRRFFPDLALVAAEHRDGLPERLGVGLARLRKSVLPDIERDTTTHRASLIRKKIDPCLPVLAAVAEHRRQTTQTLSAERLRRAWQLQNPVIEVADAWVEVRVEGPEREAISWRRGEFEDVFHLPSVANEDPGVVIFDVDPKFKDDLSRCPPLRHFGDALASLLVNNVVLGPHFSQVLASAEEGGLEDFIERNHLGALVREWSVRLRPLPDDDREKLEAHIGQLCVNPGEVLRTGRVSVADLRQDVSLSGARELEARLRRGIPEQLVSYLPAVLVASDNQLAWRRWWERRRLALAALVRALGGMPPTWEQEIQDKVQESLDGLRFDASSFAADYLRQHHPIVDLDQQLDEVAPTFSPVRSAPLPSSQAGWRAGSGRSGAGHGGPHQKLTPEELLEENIACGAIGDAAEFAFLSWVVEQVGALRSVDGFEDALLRAITPNTKTWREVKEAIKIGNLTSALHIASRWSGAGFDVLGLEQTEAGLVPVRYECKGISAVTPRIRIHLSRNELAVARRVRQEGVRQKGVGEWRLIGVQPNGVSVDLTDLISDLLDESGTLLKPLHERGLEPDGLRLVVERPTPVGAANG